MIAFAVVVLAAGASARMGQPKLLLPWTGTTVLGDLVTRWRELGATQLAVVIAPLHHNLALELDRLGVPTSHQLVNPHPEQGMFSSVQCAARWNGWHPDITHWVLTLGDQPHLRTATLRSLMEFATLNPDQVSQPSRRGRPRHPVVLPASVFHRLNKNSSGDLREFLAGMPEERALMESLDSGLDFDMDEPADYERALRHVAE